MTAHGLEAVFLANRDRLLRFLKARGGGDAAEDLLHELWLRVSAAPTGPIAEPLSYLFRAANNLMLDRRRGELRTAQRDQDWSDASGPSVAGVSDAPSGERVLIAREQLRQAEAALEALGPRVAAVFRRFRLEGVGQREIAREFGISLSAVEKDLQKAYRALIQLRSDADAE